MSSVKSRALPIHTQFTPNSISLSRRLVWLIIIPPLIQTNTFKSIGRRLVGRQHVKRWSRYSHKHHYDNLTDYVRALIDVRLTSSTVTLVTAS